MLEYLIAFLAIMNLQFGITEDKRVSLSSESLSAMEKSIDSDKINKDDLTNYIVVTPDVDPIN
jgi:hypothetical protein